MRSLIKKKREFIRLFHTVKYLRLRQIVYRLYYLFYKLSHQKLICKSANQCFWKKIWSSPGIFPSTLTTEGEITFLGEKAILKNPFEWNNPQRSKLWLYNLHYFNELNAINADSHFNLFQGLIAKWIADNPPLSGCGWEPYPLSIRIVNWIQWFSRHQEEIPQHWQTNLKQQAQALYQQIEYHILGNHLFANAKALIFVGTYFEGESADLWLRKGLSILDKEINEQFLADGGHFELSPMYHALLLWDLCDLVNLAQSSELAVLNSRCEHWVKLIRKGLCWLDAMSHPDGYISFFNDAAFNIAPEYSDILSYAKQLNIPFETTAPNPVTWLQSSGYCVVNLDDGGKAILDLAKPGADNQPGHAHADTLSFELSLFGQRIIVNSGTSLYEVCPRRLYERSTQAHNTVCIDEENSSEVWSSFRVARRARPQHIQVNEQHNRIHITASHDGYKRLPGKNIHKREWHFSPGKLIIEDTLSGKYKNAFSRLYFHPEIIVKSTEANRIVLTTLGEQDVTIVVIGYADLQLKPSYWSPQFGKQIKNYCLEIGFSTNKLWVEFMW